jgi:hypothetical protein
MRFIRALRKDRDNVVSSVYPGRAYALITTTVERVSTRRCGVAMTCDVESE